MSGPVAMPPSPDILPRLLALMPLSARHVLISGTDRLVSAYHARNPKARITRWPSGGGEGPFDLILLDGSAGDIDPARAVPDLAARLAPGGHLVAAFGNDRHHARMVAGAARGHALHARDLVGLITGAGLTMRRMRSPEPALPETASGNHPDAGPATQDHPRAPCHFTVAMRAIPGQPVRRPMRFHMCELAPHMDVRTRVPAAALAAEPDLFVTRSGSPLILPDLGPGGGVVLVQRPRMTDPEVMLGYVAASQQRGIIVVIEYDDDPRLVSRVLRRKDVPESYDRVISMAHAVQTSTGLLGDQFRRINPELAVFGNMARDLPPMRTHRPGPMRVLMGALNRSRTDALAAALAPAIAAMPETRFEVIRDTRFFDALPTRNKRLHDLQPYPQYLNLMRHCDICLMPLEGRPEELAKSDVKWVEAASRGAVAVASPAVYEATIRDGENGFLAREPGDWSRLLIALGRDAALRGRVAGTARAEVAETRMLAGQIATRRDWYLGLMARRAAIFAATRARNPDLAARLAAG